MFVDSRLIGQVEVTRALLDMPHADPIELDNIACAYVCGMEMLGLDKIPELRAALNRGRTTAKAHLIRERIRKANN